MINNQKLKKALAKFSILLLLFTYTSPIVATTIDDLQGETDSTQEEVTIDEEIAVSDDSQDELFPDSSIEESHPEISDETSEEETLTSTEETSSTDRTEVESTEESATSSETEAIVSSTESSDTVEESTSATTETSSSVISTEEAESSISSESIEEETTERETSSSKEAVAPSTSYEVPKAEQPTEENTMPTVSYPTVTRPLGSELSAQTFVASDLNGFELPLLQTYTDQREAALVAMALNYLNVPYEKDGAGPDRFDNLHFPRYLYQKVFGLSIAADFKELSTIGKKVTVSEIQPGDLLVWEKEEKMGIYLGQNKFMMADDALSKEKTTQGEEVEIPGVRIFTLHPEQEIDESDNLDLLTRYDFIRTPDYGLAKKTKWTLSAEGEKAVTQYPASFNFQENEQTNAFIASIGETARDLGLEYDLFASVMIAQAILESGGGSSGLSTAPYYNLFGIKGSIGQSSVVLPTQEDNGKGELYNIQSAFRVYPDYQASLTDYVHLIRTGISGNEQFYQGVWRSSAKNYLKATAELTGKYATDTFYYNKLNSLIATYQLTRFDQPRETVGSGMLSLAEIPLEYRNKIRFPEYNGQNYNHSGSYGSDQCTWYVYNRVTQLGGKVGDFMGNGADWKDTGLREGYQTSDVPKAGYMISFKQGVAGYHPLYGHVAFVEAVGEDGILISEGDASYLSYRIIPNEIALSSGVGYVAPK